MHLTYRMRVFRIISFGALGEAVMGLDIERAGFPFIIAKSDAGGGPLAHEFIAAKAIYLKGNEKEMKWMASLFMQHLLKDHHGTDQQNN